MKIGVLGGIGPESTREFYSILINIIQQRGIKRNPDFPQIIINSIPAPELIYDNISERNLKPYIKGLKELDSFDVDFIVMVCNTIHLFHERLQKEINTEILDLRKEMKKLLIRKNIKSFTVLGTPNTIRKGLYRFEGIRSIDINNEEMKQLTNAIFNFNRGIGKRKQIQTVKNISEKYLKAGSRIIILGCTELSLMLKNIEIPKIDTIKFFAEITVNKLEKNKSNKYAEAKD